MMNRERLSSAWTWYEGTAIPIGTFLVAVVLTLPVATENVRLWLQIAAFGTAFAAFFYFLGRNKCIVEADEDRLYVISRNRTFDVPLKEISAIRVRRFWNRVSARIEFTGDGYESAPVDFWPRGVWTGAKYPWGVERLSQLVSSAAAGAA